MDSGASSGSDASDGDGRPTKRRTGDGRKHIARKPEATAAAAPEGMLVRGAGAGAGAGRKVGGQWGKGSGRGGGLLLRTPTAHI